MCGIAGIFRGTGPIGETECGALARMLRRLAHRGPDGEGVVQTGSSILGHRRLAVIDLSSSARQPMANESEDVWLVFNGEVYNFRELRSELAAAGHVFRSSTDAEVVIHGYESWGMEALLAKLRGMFAFALLDGRRPTSVLYLARDRFGIKPLYYALSASGESLVFASELAALASSALVAVEPSREALAGFLAHGSVPSPITALESVRSLPAGHVLEVAGAPMPNRPRRYYELSCAAREDADVEDVAFRLRESVRMHLVSDVPLGCFLSGGIDSASLVALASTATRAPLTTLSLVFDDPALDESRHAREVARRYRTDHHEIRIGSPEFHDALPAVWESMDQPTVDGVNSFLVSRAAKEADLTVVLTGLGGDEVFLGYPHFRRIRTLARWFPWARAPLSLLTGRHPRLEYLREPGPGSLYRLFRGLFAPREVAELVPGAGVDPLEARSDDALEAAVELEFRRYLHDQLLRDADVMSMAHGLEARVPFLDHLLVESVMRVPHARKLRRGTNKPLLLRALGEPLPRGVWNRPKQGFTLPFRPWMLEHRDELLERTLGSGVFEAEAVRSVWSRFVGGRAHWSRPWALVAYAAWWERYRELAATAREARRAAAPALS